MVLMTANFMDQDFWNNSIRNYAWFAGAILFVIIFNRYISKLIGLLIFRMIRKAHAGNRTELFLKLILRPIQYYIVLHALFIGLTALNEPSFFENDFLSSNIHVLLISLYHFLFILNTAWILSRLAGFFIIVMREKAEKTEDPSDDQLVDFLREIFKVSIWTIAVFCVLSIVFHVNIASLIAGAGIAGIALAFAAQETLQNVFGSISIFTEKPFIVGDLVEVDGIQGTVEKVGFRSTRIRTADKTYLTIPNKTMVNNKMSNLRMRTARRLQFIAALTHDTPEDVIKKIIDDIRSYGDLHTLKNGENVVTFYNIGPSALEIWIELYFDYLDWESWMQERNDIMFEIMSIVKRNGARFAYPTQTIYLEKDDAKN